MDDGVRFIRGEGGMRGGRSERIEAEKQGP